MEKETNCQTKGVVIYIGGLNCYHPLVTYIYFKKSVGNYDEYNR